MCCLMSLITEIVGIGSTPVLSEVVVVVVHIACNGFQEKSDNPVVRVLTPRRTRRGGGWTPHKVFLEFFQDDFLSAPAVFSSSCRHIPYTHFDASLVRIGCYDVISSRWSSHFRVKLCFSPFLGEKNTNCAQKAAKCNYVIQYFT